MPIRVNYGINNLLDNYALSIATSDSSNTTTTIPLILEIVFSIVLCVATAIISCYLFHLFFDILLLYSNSFLTIGTRHGLYGLSKLNLRILSEHGNDDEQKHAKKILHVRQIGNTLMCTMLLATSLSYLLTALR